MCPIVSWILIYQFIFNYRAPPKRTLSKSLSTARKRKPDDLWRYTKEPLKQPLLKKLLGKDEVCQEACISFLDILYCVNKIVDNVIIENIR